MSLISDALKRQEQLRTAPGTGAVRSEVASAAPPEVASAAPPEVASAAPPEVASAAPPETAPRQRHNLAAPAAQPRRVSGATSPAPAARGVPATNPFLERERAAARRPNNSVLLMPILGLIVLLVLLFLRHEFIPQESTEADSPHSPRKVEEPAVDEGIELSNGAPVQDQREADEPSALRQDEASTPLPTLLGSGQREADEPSALRQDEASTPLPTRLGSGQREADEPSALRQDAEATPPPPKTWPAFTLAGIAVGRERLAILNTGEMLQAGETAKCGVKIEKVNASTVVFAWGGETKTLRKGEQSDKPVDGK